MVQLNLSDKGNYNTKVIVIIIGNYAGIGSAIIFIHYVVLLKRMFHM